MHSLNATDTLIKKLQKIFRTNIVENGRGQILLLVVLMIDIWLKLQMEIVK